MLPLEQQRVLPHRLLPLHLMHSFLDSIQQLAPGGSLCLQHLPHIRDCHSAFSTLPLHDQIYGVSWPEVHNYWIA